MLKSSRRFIRKWTIIICQKFWISYHILVSCRSVKNIIQLRCNIRTMSWWSDMLAPYFIFKQTLAGSLGLSRKSQKPLLAHNCASTWTNFQNIFVTAFNRKVSNKSSSHRYREIKPGILVIFQLNSWIATSQKVASHKLILYYIDKKIKIRHKSNLIRLGNNHH